MKQAKLESVTLATDAAAALALEIFVSPPDGMMAIELPDGRRVFALKAGPDGRTISGRAAVVDGDTINVSGTRVRFNGVDVPESAQLCQNVTG
ncbi:MAG: hypothetical protein ABS58_04385 [Mesorhizobium sp. SCN 65-20]|nr:MAG: hypothetical protein ABS58_04385 [Mesorhizobium sp. SCN 65-20]